MKDAISHHPQNFIFPQEIAPTTTVIHITKKAIGEFIRVKLDICCFKSILIEIHKRVFALLTSLFPEGIVSQEGLWTHNQKPILAPLAKRLLPFNTIPVKKSQRRSTRKFEPQIS